MYAAAGDGGIDAGGTMMSHTIYVLNIDGLGISDEAFIGYVENEVTAEMIRTLGIDRIAPAKDRELILSDFGDLEKHFDENLTIRLNRKELQRLVLKRYLQAEIMLYSCLNGDESRLMNLILKKQKIIDLLDEVTDAIFIMPMMKEQNSLGLGSLLDNLYLLSLATRQEVKIRLIKGYKYYI